MTQFEKIENMSPSGTLKSVEVSRMADTLRRGGLVILPTETGYMLAVDATRPDAVLRAFKVKGRPLTNVMHIACASMDMASRYAQLSVRAMRLLGDLTPGPLSVIVATNSDALSPHVILNHTVGIRIPDHPATLQVIESLGHPVTATSLNESGSSAISVSESELSKLDWPAEEVVQVLDIGNSVPYPMPSTLVRVTGPEVEILRPGPISGAVVKRIAGQMSYLEVADWT